MSKVTYIEPQPGFQINFLANEADIVIGGGAAGVSKTFSLLMETCRHIGNKMFRSVIFRVTSPQIRNPGGLWDKSMHIFPGAGGDPKNSILEWWFPSGAKTMFRHLDGMKDALEWMGTEVDLIEFDELTHFSKEVFFYLITRGRTMSGITPYVRASCNPDPDGWVYEFIQWWIDPETGYPIPERDGVIRFFARDGDNYIWGDSYQEVYDKGSYFLQPQIEKSGGLITMQDVIKTVSFVSGSIYDNKKLLETNPQYIGGLLAQDEDTVLALLKGCWKARVSPNDVYNYEAFKGLFDNVKEVDRKGKYITADIALEGSNMLVVGYWEGWELMDVEILDKSDGPQVIQLISEVAKYYGVENRHICYDADGVGGYVGGYIRGAIPFHGGSPAVEVKDQASNKIIKENYKNYKTQCYYHSGATVNKGLAKINARCANKMYSQTMTIRQRFMWERRAIRKDKIDAELKLCILPKKEMKVLLNNESPDLMDMFSLRSHFDIKPAKTFVG